MPWNCQVAVQQFQFDLSKSDRGTDTSGETNKSEVSLVRRRISDAVPRNENSISRTIFYFASDLLSRFQMTNCLLNRYFGESNRITHATAAFIGGMPYYFFADELSILTHGFSSALELAWARYLRSLDKSSKQYQYASAIPFSCIVYIVGGAFMYNVRVFYPWLTPKFLFRLIQLLTNQKYFIKPSLF